jgi:hypothetical protein
MAIIRHSGEQSENFRKGDVMSIGSRLVVAFMSALVLSACATQPEIPYDKSQAANIKTIGILTPSMPGKPTIWLASDIGQSFGLIGALVDASIQAHRDDVFWKSIDGDQHPPRTAFLNALSGSLRQRGFAVQEVAVTRPDGKFLSAYPKSGGGVDAYLDIAFIGSGYGYVAAAMGKATPFRPFAYVQCRLVRASDGATLMEDTVLDNPINAPKTVVTVAPDPSYAFTNFDALNADPTKAVAGMDEAFQKAADTVGDLLH